MGQAIGLGVLIVVTGIFLPDVLSALEEFFLTLLSKATFFVGALNVP